MSDKDVMRLSGGRNILLAIATGGIIAGTLDLLQACILFGWDIPLAIAGGMLGPKAFHDDRPHMLWASCFTSLLRSRLRRSTAR